MRCGVLVLAGLAVAEAVTAQVPEEEALRRFTQAYLSHAYRAVVELRVDRRAATPGKGYAAITAIRSTPAGQTEQLSLLLDPETRMVTVGLAFPLNASDPAVTPATLPAFAERVLPGVLQQMFGTRMRVSWPAIPMRPSGVVPLVAQMSTGYGNSPVPIAITADARLLVLGNTWPLDRDPRQVRREILKNATIQWGTGNPSAPLQLVEFSDYQCPACKRGWSEAKKVLERMGDKVRHGLVNYPLVQNHPWAFRASVAGVCVGQQSEALVLELKEEMYRLQSTLTPSTVDDAAFAFVAQRGLDEAAFRACYLKDSAVEQVLAQMGVAQRMGVLGTPTYFVNGEMIALGDTEAAVARMNAILAAGGVPERAAADPRR